ncbi:MAG: hypothetical protein H5U40_10450 [Polyangiaceae bacterium]|nr:hypothetical protein [Polyangiaceae bacterium]
MALPWAEADLERWAAAAHGLPMARPPNYSVPLRVLLDEAVEAADFTDHYWNPVVENGVTVRPGLVSAAGKGRGFSLHPGFGEEIRSLQRATSAAHSEYELAARLAGSPAERGHHVYGEMRAALEFLCDDDVLDALDRQVETLAKNHDARPTSLAALALGLDSYAALAQRHRATLDELGGFSADMIDEAVELAHAIRQRTRAPQVITKEARAALDLRDRYASLLIERVQALRATARYVFRAHPSIVREATSDYERARRMKRVDDAPSDVEPALDGEALSSSEARRVTEPVAG